MCVGREGGGGTRLISVYSAQVQLLLSLDAQVLLLHALLSQLLSDLPRNCCCVPLFAALQHTTACTLLLHGLGHSAMTCVLQCAHLEHVVLCSCMWAAVAASMWGNVGALVTSVGWWMSGPAYLPECASAHPVPG